ncbi:Crp/Fnr family transcriptional regulator [Mucilaginibacter sp. BJC16-A38]|uniref:Crp/Fnr family transcriptional regulator n=1 Tax=Mucilaginibacter phenanthrenivorans TaxID=1234842 RepID=UPI0021572757|nr:Crp/Fnr family transcriptional regulator [Mucilaginibacter phenanthrenivorans]MCR8558778.1 Crp/Fnr family transcriptional regulator [Mucilaginibacter phenanthrenivorans]
MLFHFKDKFPQLSTYWDKYLEFQQRMEVPAKTVLLEEGKVSGHYFFVEKGCVRLCFNNNGNDKTVQFFFENEGLTSFESFLKNTPSLFTIETIEPSVVYLLPKKHLTNLMDELSQEPDFIKMMLAISAERQLHYMHEFVSFIRDTPEQRYQNLVSERPHIVQRVPQHYIASYLGVSRVHLSRIKSALAKKR